MPESCFYCLAFQSLEQLFGVFFIRQFYPGVPSLYLEAVSDSKHMYFGNHIV